MNIEDLLIEGLTVDDDEIVFENDYMKVIKVIKEVSTGSKHYVKRLQLVVWKNKNTDVPDFDIRTFSYKDNKYKKGITLTSIEMQELYKALDEFYQG